MVMRRPRDSVCISKGSSGRIGRYCMLVRISDGVIYHGRYGSLSKRRII